MSAARKLREPGVVPWMSGPPPQKAKSVLSRYASDTTRQVGRILQPKRVFMHHESMGLCTAVLLDNGRWFDTSIDRVDGVIGGYNRGAPLALEIAFTLGLLSGKEVSAFSDWFRAESEVAEKQRAERDLREQATRLGYKLTKNG